MNELIRHYWVPGGITLLIWLLVGIFLGPELFVMVVILTLLEMTLSADNAVVNSRVLITMSPLWQRLFMTVGIFIAVFVIRFAIPIFSVSLSTPLDANQTLQLALHDPTLYGEKLELAGPMINAFGGIFLSLVAIFFFIDNTRRDFWVRPIERPLARLGQIKFSRSIIAAVIIALVFVLTDKPHRLLIGTSMLLAAFVYGIIHISVLAMEKINKDNTKVHKVGWAALISFLYLEVLDASFSLDGVVGAFALTNNVIVITVGLGVGALWVRSMTLHLAKNNTLLKYKFLESGAHWAISFLAIIMILKLFHIELFEILVGTIGLVFIGLSIKSSGRTETEE